MYALQAIETRYHGPTNFRGSRYSARAESVKTLFVRVPDELDGLESHAYAAQKFAEKMGWYGRWYAGGSRAGYVFVRVPNGTVGEVAFIVEEKE